MSLWLNLRRSFKHPRSSPTSPILTNTNTNNPVINVAGYSTIKEEGTSEVFKFPYGTKECVVYKEKGKNKKVEADGINGKGKKGKGEKDICF